MLLANINTFKYKYIGKSIRCFDSVKRELYMSSCMILLLKLGVDLWVLPLK